MSDRGQADLLQLETLLAESAARRKDRAAFEQLVHRTARLVWSSIFLRVRNTASADELTQDAFLAAWKSIGTLSEPDRFRSWLLAIAHRTVEDDHRRNARLKRQKIDAGSKPLETAADRSHSPIESAELNEQQQRALDAIAQLPEQYQQVLVLRFLGGADYAAMERQLALSNGSLRGLLHRGLELLREKLKEPD